MDTDDWAEVPPQAQECILCGRHVSADEAQTLRDLIVAAQRKAEAEAPEGAELGFLGGIILIVADSMCTTCFHQKSEDLPFHEFLGELYADPLTNPILFTWQRVPRA